MIFTYLLLVLLLAVDANAASESVANLQGVFKQIDGITIQASALGYWATATESADSAVGVIALLGYQNTTGASCTSNSTAQNYKSNWTSSNYTISASFTLSGGSITAAQSTTSPFCEIGFVNKTDLAFAFSTSTKQCPTQLYGKEQKVTYGQMKRLPLKNLPVDFQCATNKSPPSSIPSTLPSTSFPLLPNVGHPPSHAGQFVADAPGVYGVGVITNKGFTFFNVINGSMSAVQGYFTSYNCTGPYSFVGITNKRLIDSQGNVSAWFSTCEAASYDPQTKISKGVVSDTECPSLDDSKSGKDWVRYESTVVDGLKYHPSVEMCVNGGSAPAPGGKPSGGVGTVAGVSFVIATIIAVLV